MDSASPGRLNALAVLAFCAEMTRLPGHWSPRSWPVKATAHTTPSRLTTVAHISRSESAVRLRLRRLERPTQRRVGGETLAGAPFVVSGACQRAAECEGSEKGRDRDQPSVRPHRALHSAAWQA